ncbi:cytochrome c oxidase assembly protein [Rhodobacteraceae bacterium D3-12]|nr:cytochrome c oxidase assembly protein [Rhodobacteraceae bacterium D3-12]
MATDPKNTDSTKMDPKKKTLAMTVGVVLVMGALAWASVPFYDWFCRVTGFGGVPQTADSASDKILERTVKVRFDASQAKGFGWEFKPMQKEMELRIGETGLAFYEAHNPTDRPIAGQASYNVTPYEAGYFFNKIECFCFTEQVLQPGERVEMPVTFYVDPEMVDDRDAKFVHTITLSYTFYEIDLPADDKTAQRKDREPIDNNQASNEG